MNKKIIITLFALLIGFSFHSCKQEIGPILEIVTPATIISPTSGGVYVLTDDMGDDIFAVFAWTEAEYNVAISMSYVLEVDLKANNFSEPVVLGETTNDSLEFTVFDFNALLTNTFGLTPGLASELSFRVGSFGGESEKSYSSAVDMTVTPYNPPFAPDRFYIISGGEVLGSIVPTDDSGNYEGYVWFPAANLEFVFSDTETGDDVYGDNEPDDVMELDGSNIVLAEEGHYKINVSSYDFSYSTLKQDWAIIGSAVPNYDWGTDVDMAYIVDEGVWRIETDTLSLGPILDGMIKFRPNDSWEPFNWGDDEPDGIPEDHGADIPITAGDYIITLDMREYPYLYTIEPM